MFYANLAAEVITWTVLALWAKKTPVKPHLVFAIGWIAECAGNTLGQVVTPLFAAQDHLFFAVAIPLAVSFAFSKGHLILEVDFEDEDRTDAAADKQGSKTDPIAASQKADAGQGSKNQELRFTKRKLRASSVDFRPPPLQAPPAFNPVSPIAIIQTAEARTKSMMPTRKVERLYVANRARL